MDNNENKIYDGTNGCYESPVNNNSDCYENNHLDNNLNVNYNKINAPDYIVWLALGIVQIVTLCCCNVASFITGIITVVFVIKANMHYRNEDMNNYTSKMKVAKVSNIIGIVFILIYIIVIISGGIIEIVKRLAS